MLELKNISKLYSVKNNKTKKTESVGVENISFTARKGRIFGLIGANGAGKTTTMRVISGLIKPNEGDLLFDDQNFLKIKQLKKLISFVSNETQIYDRLTPRETLDIFSRMSGMTKDESTEKINIISKKLMMQDFIDKVAQNFSTGMKQKVSIARAIITEPKVLIFDEITSGLDIFAAKNVKDLILDLKENNRVIIFSTHILSDVDELCDDIGIIHKGKLLETGDLDEMKKKYNVRTAKDLFFKILEANGEDWAAENFI